MIHAERTSVHDRHARVLEAGFHNHRRDVTLGVTSGQQHHGQNGDALHTAGNQAIKGHAGRRVTHFEVANFNGKVGSRCTDMTADGGHFAATHVTVRTVADQQKTVGCLSRTKRWVETGPRDLQQRERRDVHG